MAWYKFTMSSEELAELEHFRLLDTVEHLRSASHTDRAMVLFEDKEYGGPERVYYLFSSRGSNRELSELLAQFPAVTCEEPIDRELRLVVGEWNCLFPGETLAG